MRKFQKMTLKYIIEELPNYKIINEINTNLEMIDSFDLRIKLSRFSEIKYDFVNEHLKHIEITIDHNNSKIILSRKE
jgi:hypothetical protein